MWEWGEGWKEEKSRGKRKLEFGCSLTWEKQVLPSGKRGLCRPGLDWNGTRCRWHIAAEQVGVQRRESTKRNYQEHRAHYSNLAEFLTLLPRLLECWDSRCVAPCPVYAGSLRQDFMHARLALYQWLHQHSHRKLRGGDPRVR